MIKHLKDMLNFKRGDVSSPKSLKRTRSLVYIATSVIFFSCLFMLFASGETGVSSKSKKSNKSVVSADEIVDSREIWVNRIEQQSEKARKEIDQVKRENNILRQKIDVLDEVFTKYGTNNQALKSKVEEEVVPQVESLEVRAQPLTSSSFNKNYSAEELSNDKKLYEKNPTHLNQSASVENDFKMSKILHLSLGDQEVNLRKTVDAYIPAGTYSRAVLTSGVVASTSSTAQGDPQPIFVRLVDHGNIPRGFKGDLKDAVLIGACYGDLSSERAYCRIHKLSLTERNGEIIEKKVEGWLVGEDGRPGLKGIVVDRAGEVARGALVSGILGGMAGFFKQQTTSSVFPVSPFGQTNALKTGQVLSASAANGAGNALEKLADFTIKRAEALQPVILVNPGREVDVVFKEGIDFSQSGVKQNMMLIGKNARENHAKDEALNHEYQMK